VGRDALLLEGVGARDQTVHQHAHGEQISGRADLAVATQQHLEGHVAQGARQGALEGLALLEGLGQPQIRQPGVERTVTPPVQQHVGQLDVQVQDAPGMQAGQGAEGLVQQATVQGPGRVAAAQLEQAPGVREGQGQVGPSVRELTQVVQRDEVRMNHAGGDGHLALEAGLELGGGHHVLAHHLHGHLVSEETVAGPKDVRHASRAQERSLGRGQRLVALRKPRTDRWW
jgi:hypothetical protein